MLSKKYISGIYNHCDRWCEKCNCTDKCFVFSKENDTKIKQSDNFSAFETLSSEIQDTIDLLRKVVVDEGLDDEFLNINENDDENYNKLFDVAENSEISLLSKKYYTDVEKILKIIRKIISDKHDIINKQAALGINTEFLEQDFDYVDSAVEIILYYQYFIHSKLLIAIEEKMLTDEFSDLSIFNFNGNSKVAIIAIEKSIEAWKNLLTIVPEIQDEIIDYLALLQKILKKTEIEFPEARHFKREGLD